MLQTGVRERAGGRGTRRSAWPQMADGDGVRRGGVDGGRRAGLDGDLGVPEDAGGAGLGFVEEVADRRRSWAGPVPRAVPARPSLALPALGRAVRPTSRRRSASGDAARHRGAGRRPTALDVGAAERSTRTTAGRLSGRRSFVPDLDAADLVVVAADGRGRTGLCACRLERTASRRASLPTVDTTRRLGRLALDGAAGRHLARRRRDGLVATLRGGPWPRSAAEAVGVAQRALDLAVEHAGRASSSARPIGAYQAVSHRAGRRVRRRSRARGRWRAGRRGRSEHGAPDATPAAAAAKARGRRGGRRTACDGRSRCTAGSGSPGSTRSTGSTSGRSEPSAFLGWPSEHRARIASSLLD